MNVWGKVILCYSVGIAIGLVLFFLEKLLDNTLNKIRMKKKKDEIKDAFKNSNIVEIKSSKDKFKR